VWQTRGRQCQPSFTYKNKINVNIQQYCCITITQAFIWLEAQHISSALTHHTHNIKCIWFWFELLQYRYCNSCVEGSNFVIKYFTWQTIMSLPVGSAVLTVMGGCDMELLGVGNCPQMRCNVNHTVSWSNSVPTILCNRLHTYGHVQHWCGSKDPSTVQLLTDTTVLQ
jgi:hypothetical protein